MMDKSSVESLGEDEKHELLCGAISSLVNGDKDQPVELRNKIIELTSSSKEIITNHSCSPMGPYPLDGLYRVAYIVDNNGTTLGKINYYVCGQKGTNCDYLAAVTILY